MTETAGHEFDDLMNHRIKVTSRSGIDDYGQVTYDPATARTYPCLLNVDENIQRDISGTTVGIALTAYVRAIPVGATTPQLILETDKVEITTPAGVYPLRPVASIATHYDETGQPHNQVVRFS